MKESTLKKIIITLTVLCSLILPLITFFTIKIFINFLPDSFQLIIISSAALATISLYKIFEIFKNKKTFSILSNILFLINLTIWSSLYIQEFFIYRPQIWLIIIFSVITIALFVFMMILKSNFSKVDSFFYIINFLFTALILFTALLAAVNSKRLYSIPFCFAALSLTSLLFFKILSQKHLGKKKWEEIICYLLLISSQFLFSLTNITMICGF